MDWRQLESFAFGDSGELADWLLALVLEGKKRATCWAVAEGMKGAELTRRRFDAVDASFAYDEGEGDRSLDYWRAAHQCYFTRLKLYQPDMMLWCERFELVLTIPVEAD
jgi:uncharacterized protein YhfF